MTSCVFPTTLELPLLELPLNPSPTKHLDENEIDDFICKLFGLGVFKKCITDNNASKSKKTLRTILKKPSQKSVGKTVRFSEKVTCHIIPRRIEDISKDTTSGFGSLGTVGEMEAYEAQASIWSAPTQPKRRLAPLSASRIVQRRWRLLKIKALKGHC